ncbi:flagellar biosynthesis anti-sigma factor FlgM [Shewanella sp. D64]|uniref:flagellar biosynthesis anti-sigma factor FlgM n=1 Tax=unclassified Shewanella TaxID=196818 RepID=UPI0022BA15B1|nr:MULTISPECIES: flagellar biosynthesis anti-sigma factor FlgM [unclassified Shewanella]MEC4725919.1 flagellar biosynthesis anti-sigma factor FlgM [Shewanella sp. D64]MEC4737174.1 flagellar biosynthesis anti-sigma factor FlgM [Shewanella sp. E94]WBJ95634.1 flagellar biosynthesis anti-sigma factor FlgM [Shewanella sp. MTB7]
MEIQKINSAISADIGTRKGAVKTPDSPEKVQILQPEQKVVSDDCKLLASSLEELEQIEDVDQAKMLEIRQSLRDGSFKLDIDVISEAMLKQHG